MTGGIAAAQDKSNGDKLKSDAYYTPGLKLAKYRPSVTILLAGEKSEGFSELIVSRDGEEIRFSAADIWEALRSDV
jgi:hypothetical protein